MKIQSPDNLSWEVEAAHIVPHSDLGKDDIWNGIALCRLHHRAFDVGWFTIENDFKILISEKIKSLPQNHGKLFNNDFLSVKEGNLTIILPESEQLYPHANSLLWHKANKFYH